MCAQKQIKMKIPLLKGEINDNDVNDDVDKDQNDVDNSTSSVSRHLCAMRLCFASPDLSWCVAARSNGGEVEE